MQSRKRLFLLVIGAAVLFGAGGFVLGQRLESPEDARAQVAAPEPSLIAVPVESTALSNDVVVRGDAEFEGAVDLVLDATLGDGSSRVVTGLVPEIDSVVNEGEVVIEVSGRPVFMLEGSLPTFREFKPGLEGDDVLQLEEALVRLGYLNVEPDRLYGAATEEAVSAMYEAAGYEARAASEGEEAQLDVLRDQVESAREGLANANDGLDKAREPISELTRFDQAEQRQNLVEAITNAQEAERDAQTNLDDIRNSTPSPQLLDAIDQATQIADDGTPDAIAATNRQLAQLQEADELRLEGAEDGLERAGEAIADTQEALRDFDKRIRLQDAEFGDTDAAEDAVEDATDRLADLELDLEELEEDIGVRLPTAEVVFLPSLPRSITSVDVERGDFVTGPVMRISGTEVRITSAVSESNRPLLEVGQRVVIDSSQLGIEVDGEIAELADRTGTEGVADTRYYMMIVPTGDDYNVSEMVGVNFRLQIPLEKSDGEVLAVPQAALFIGADGSSRLRVMEDDDETTRIVKVEVGLSDKSRSLVEVTPESGDLSIDDFVVVGVDNPVPVEPSEADSDSGDSDDSDSDSGDSDSGEEDGGS